MTHKQLPDIALESQASFLTPIDWVGMAAIELPILLQQQDGVFRVPARADAKVSLDKKASRGIHMSRLYMSTQELLSRNVLSLDLLGQLTEQFLVSHQDLSSRATLEVSFESPLKRDSLKSGLQSWRTYPVRMSALNDGNTKYYIDLKVTYSSTCPASAALARQLIQEQFKKDFQSGSIDADAVHAWLGTKEGIVATPHAQRSFARVKVEVEKSFNFETLIDLIEDSLKTAVQGAVKRADEQEFSLKNGQNLMFCEDAARRVAAALTSHSGILDFIAEFEHVESLHPHSAVSRITKGLRLDHF